MQQVPYTTRVVSTDIKEKTKKIKDGTYAAAELTGHFAGTYGGGIVALVIVAATLSLSFIAITKNDNYLYPNFVVHTGYRTHDPYELNGYYIPTQKQSIYTRLYYCMVDVGIGTDVCQPGAGDASIENFQQCIEAKYDCTAHTVIPVPWVRDTQFLGCLQNNFKTSFNVSTSQTYAFLDCLDSSMIASTESIQGLNSKVFLGSYNYVSFILTAMTILSSFVVATWGGFFTITSFTISGDGDIEGLFTPLSRFVVLVAFVWNLIALLFAMGILYPTSNIIQNYPVTTSTSNLVVGVLWAVVVFFAYYVIRDYYYGVQWTSRVTPLPSNIVAPDPNAPPPPPGIRPPPGFPPASGLAPLPGRLPPSRGDEESSEFDTLLPDGSVTRRTARRSGPRRRDVDSFFSYIPVYHRITGQYLGVEVVPGHNNTEEPFHVMSPLMIQFFAWSFVFVDGLFFVGMLTPQNSVLSEDATNIFFFATFARLYQLAHAYLFNKAYIHNNEYLSKNNGKYQDDLRRFGAQASTIMAYIASLWCLSNVFYPYMRNWDYITGTPAQSTSLYFIQLGVLVGLGILPEVLRAILLVILSWTPCSSYFIMVYTELVFTLEWLLRMVLGFLLITNVPYNLKDSRDQLRTFLMLGQ